MGRSYYNGTFIRWTASLDPIVSDVRLGMGVDIGAIRRFPVAQISDGDGGYCRIAIIVDDVVTLVAPVLVLWDPGFTDRPPKRYRE